MFKDIDMSPSSKFWWVIYALVVIALMVFVHPIIIVPVMMVMMLTVAVLQYGILRRIVGVLGEFFTRIFVNPVKSFNCWLDSKFRK